MITSFTDTPAGGNLYRLEFSSDLGDGTTFYVYRDGELIATTDANFVIVTVLAGEDPIFEVFDDPDAVPAFAYPGFANLTWYATDGTAEYRVEQYIAGVWTTLISLPEDGRGYYRYRSATLADSTNHQFRVTPVGTNGNDGTAKTFNLLMVRIPDVPGVTYTYDAGTGSVTIDAA